MDEGRFKRLLHDFEVGKVALQLTISQFGYRLGVDAITHDQLDRVLTAMQRMASAELEA